MLYRPGGDEGDELEGNEGDDAFVNGPAFPNGIGFGFPWIFFSLPVAPHPRHVHFQE